MNQRRPHRLPRAATALAAAALLLGPVLAGGPLASAAAPAGQLGVRVVVAPSAAAGLASAGIDDTGALTALVASAALERGDQTLEALVDSGREVQVQVKRATGGWAFGVTVVTAATDAHGGPQGWVYLARHLDDRWEVAVEGSPAFAGMVDATPIFDARERRTYAGYSAIPPGTGAPAGEPATATRMRLPWQLDVSWTLAGGPHRWGGTSQPSGPYSSVDLAGGDEKVRATRAGNALVMCASGLGWIRVIHDNGFSTDYYHLWENIDSDRPVKSGTFLGYTGTDISCGGAASARHVHFAIRKYNDQLQGWYVPIDGKKLGGWTFHEVAQQYEGYATHAGEQVWPGGRLYNYGAGGGSDDPPTKAEVWAEPGDRVNLRAGPGTDYDIVGSRVDGDPVSIECTARGTLVDGMDGPTDLWNKLSSGKWISDGFTWTGTGDPVEEPC